MKGVVFDLDGTLLDSMPTIKRCLNAILVKYGSAPLNDAELRPQIGRKFRDILSERITNVEPAFKDYRELQLATFQQDTKAYPGAHRMLKRLSARDVQMAIVTMRIGRVARTIVGAYDLTPPVKAVLGDDEVEKPKPFPEAIWGACKALGTKPEDTIVVGDTRFDILAGKAAGCRAIGVTWGYGRSEEMREAGADLLVDDFDELEQAILSYETME
jgi:2-phosphoglycolate phosphatase